MQRLVLIGLILLGSFGALTGVFFGLMVHFQNAIPTDICRFIPLNFTDVVEGRDVQCAITTNHTMNCGSWSFADVSYDGPCGKFNVESYITYNGNKYSLNEYVCYNIDCVWDGDKYYYNIILTMQIIGILCVTFAGGALIMTIVTWCGENRNKMHH